MKNWNDYKDYVKSTDKKRGKDLANMEELANIISVVIEERNALGLSQRELADMCGIPQSSVARIESFKTTPKLTTLLKILRSLGLKLSLTKNS